MPSSASATFGVSGFNYTQTQLTGQPAAYQAASHPFTSISFSRTGAENEDLQNVLLDLPTGVFANPESAAPKCNGGTPPNKTATNYWANDNCSAGSQVGNVSLDITAASLLNITAPGTINLLTPDPGQVATLGITVRPAAICILFIFCAQPDKVMLKTGITVRTYEDSGLRTYTPGAPRTTSIAIPPIVKSGLINLDITVKKMTLNFQSRAGNAQAGTIGSTKVYGTGAYFWTQTGSCVTATSKLVATSYNNASATATKTFVPTGCPGVGFSPTLAFSVANTQAGASTTPTFKLNIPDADAAIQSALPKIVDVDFPFGSGIDLNNLTGVTACTETQLKAMACPASSIIGTANAFSKYLPPETGTGPGIVGNVYAMGIGNQIPIGVQLIGPRNTVVIFRGTLGTRGDANVGTGRVYALFDRIPQLPFKEFNMTVSKAIYKNPDNSCGTNTLSAKVTAVNGTDATSGNGTVVNTTATYPVTGCATVPDTTITNGPPSTTTNDKPPITFTSSIPAGATFQCKYDSDAYQACTSPYTPTLPLSNAPHTFSVYACNGLACDSASPATITFTVNRTSTYAITLPTGVTMSTTVAAAHPNLSTTVNASNGQPKSLSIKLPAGLNASLSAVPLCSPTDAAAGNCAAASKVGTLQITAQTFSGPDTGIGDVFLTSAPTANDAGGVAVKVPLAVGTFIAQGGANLVNNGNNQNLEIRDFPTIIGGNDITITQLVLGLSGANRFLTNASNCSATDGFVANSQAFDGSNANPVPAAYQSTCTPAPPFAPTLNLALTNPTAGQTTGVTADVTLPIDSSTIKTVRTTLPPALGPNYPAFGDAADQCPSASAPTPTSVFNPAACPAQAKVGTMTLTTPLLPTPLVGDVYLINKSPLPWFGIKFDQPGISVRLVGVTSLPKVVPTCDEATEPSGFCQSQISVVFNNVPDVPVSHITLSLNGPARTGVSGSLPGQVLNVAAPGDSTCVSGGPAKSTVTPYAAGSTVASLTQAITINGC
jgi:hypothetical protein